MTTLDMLSVTGGYVPIITCVFPRFQFEPVAFPATFPDAPRHAEDRPYLTLYRGMP
ncbi:hypothetical protein GGR26_000464 [Lewinella marina]|nr:hypothetical protein [Neolewinella marina]